MSKLLLAFVLVFTAMAADTPVAEQLAKAIYTQDTTGDLDEAIRLYRQILAASPQRALAAQAQFRLAQCLLQKGDVSAAVSEFQTLASLYPEQRDLISSLARRMNGASSSVRVSLGTLNISQSSNGTPAGQYHHSLTGIQVPFSDGWMVRGDGDSSGGGEMVFLHDTVSRAGGFIWMKPYDGKGNIDEVLRGDLAAKASMRESDWQVRQNTVQRNSISGEQALTAVADYKENGREMVEHLVWIRNAKVHLFFSMRIPAAEYAAHVSRFERFIANVKLP